MGTEVWKEAKMEEDGGKWKGRELVVPHQKPKSGCASGQNYIAYTDHI